MKFKDTLKFSFRFFRRDKALILFTVAIVSILFTVINFCGYMISSLIRSYSNDIKGYLQSVGAVEIWMWQYNEPGEKWGIYQDNFLFVQEKLSPYQIETNRKIKATDLTIEFGEHWEHKSASVTVKPIDFSIATELQAGEDWKEAEKGLPNIWVSADYYQLLCPTGNKDVDVRINEQTYRLAVKGIVEGNWEVYGDAEFLLEEDIAYISSAQFNVYGIKDLKSLKKLNATVEDVEKDCAKIYVVCEALEILERDSFHTTLVSVLCVAVSVLMAGLVLYMLNNFISVHIYDNMKFYAILRCLGARNHCLTPMILIEIICILLCGFTVSNIVNIFTKRWIHGILLAFLYDDFIAIENLHVVKWWWGSLLVPVVIFAINYLFAKVKNQVLFKNEALLERFKEEL